MISFLARVGVPLTLLRAVVTLLCLAPVTVSSEGLPDELTVRYTLTHGKLKLGSVEKTLSRDGDNYTLVADTKANAVVQLFTDGDLHEETKFTLAKGELYPQQYSVVRDGKKGYEREVTFDWKRRVLNYADGRVESIPSGYVTDSGSILFAMMLDTARLTAGPTLSVVNGKDIDTYRVEMAGKETLATPIGNLNTIKLIQHRVDKPNRQLSVWLAVDKGNLPVKIERRKKDKTSTLMIDSVSGL